MIFTSAARYEEPVGSKHDVVDMYGEELNHNKLQGVDESGAAKFQIQGYKYKLSMLESAQVSPIGAMNDGGYRRWPSAKGVGKKDSSNSNDNDAGGMRPVENVVGKFKFMGCIIDKLAVVIRDCCVT
ncbi:hypothetical protein BDP27DRAFT_1364615 [Rhodocollybia butyracea]|uniref:Uncharacterized protein n=1 Tax=Rhodocollybia butyracea TaxID=206335 RepID=A0A9P5U7E4_9AGAR|nr:hypothetical protein BDP27DRAFT_1364615 [Rhodocollybia butyracea]